MYVACKEIKVSVKGKPQVIKAGHVIPDTDSWHPTAIMANVNLGNIQLVPDEAPKKGKKAAPAEE